MCQNIVVIYKYIYTAYTYCILYVHFPPVIPVLSIFSTEQTERNPAEIVLISILWISIIDLISLIKSMSGLWGAALAVGTGPTHSSPHAKTKPWKIWKVKTSLFHCQWLSLFTSWRRDESIDRNCALWNSKFSASYVVRNNLRSWNFTPESQRNCYNPEFTIQYSRPLKNIESCTLHHLSAAWSVIRFIKKSSQQHRAVSCAFMGKLLRTVLLYAGMD